MEAAVGAAGSRVDVYRCGLCRSGVDLISERDDPRVTFPRTEVKSSQELIDSRA